MLHAATTQTAWHPLPAALQTTRARRWTPPPPWQMRWTCEEAACTWQHAAPLRGASCLDSHRHRGCSAASGPSGRRRRCPAACQASRARSLAPWQACAARTGPAGGAASACALPAHSCLQVVSRPLLPRLTPASPSPLLSGRPKHCALAPPPSAWPLPWPPPGPRTCVPPAAASQAGWPAPFFPLPFFALV